MIERLLIKAIRKLFDEAKEIIERLLIKAIRKLFSDKWEYFELGSSQADLIEAHVIKTIKDTLKGIE